MNRHQRWSARLLLLLCAISMTGCNTRPSESTPGATDTGPDLRTPYPADPANPEGLHRIEGELPPDSGTLPDEGAAETEALANASFALLGRSRDAEAAGNRAAAIAYVERALRLSPRAATLWIELGRLQLPGAPLIAQRYARKALALTTPATEDYAAAWRLIADAKALDGDEAAAEAIRDRFRTGTG